MKHFLLWDGVLTHTSSSSESQASAECQSIFSYQNATSTGLMRSEDNEYQGMTIIPTRWHSGKGKAMEIATRSVVNRRGQRRGMKR